MFTDRQRRILALLAVRRRRRRRLMRLAEGEEDRPDRRRFWVHPILVRRPEQGDYRHLFMELRQDEERFQEHFRLSVEQFDWLLDKVKAQIEKQDTFWREAISPAERLAICLRYLAHGDSFGMIASNYRVGRSTVAGIVPTVAEAIWECLAPELMPVPTKEDWEASANGFGQKWNFPHCVGALDGKHIVIRRPMHSGSRFYNYKGQYSIVLLAVVDANYLFRVVDVGGYGCSNDSGILWASEFGQALREGTLNLPDDDPLPNAEHLGPVPYVLVADEAFPLRRDMMRPVPGRYLETYSQRIYNYRLSRARMVVECAFGIMVSKFRIYHRVMELSPDNAGKIVRATTVLHNLLRWHQEASHMTPEETPDSVYQFGGVGSDSSGEEARSVRNTFVEFFSSPAGAVSWQDTHV